MALASAMFALVAASILVAGVFAFADLSAKANLNQERASRATHVAEAGMAHAISLLRGQLRPLNFTRILRGSDNIIPTLDDSLLSGAWGVALPLADQILLTGTTYQGHNYKVFVRDDPADTDGNPNADMNGRIRVRCVATTTDGATAEVWAIVGAIPMPGVVTDGNLEISSAATISGACGSIHTNGNITGGGSPTVTVSASATGTVGPGSLSPQLEGQPAMNVPDLNPEDYWSSCTHFWPSGMTLSSSTAYPATHCVTGNVTSSGDFGSLTTMRPISIIATGYIKFGSKPFIRANHPDGLLLLAGGDLDLQGDWGGAGWIYAEGHCYISSKPNINGSLMCKSKPSAVGPVSANLISGDAIITFDCSTNSFNKRRALFWYPRIG
jgi:hypothetical protein